MNEFLIKHSISETIGHMVQSARNGCVGVAEQRSRTKCFSLLTNCLGMHTKSSNESNEFQALIAASTI